MNILTAIREPVRPFLRIFSLLLRSAVLLCNLLGLVGFFVRDRTVLLAFFMYLPLLPIGVVAIGLGVLDWRRRRFPWLRRGLMLVGLASALVGSWWMIGLGAKASASPGDEVTILHWNVLWGGYWKSSQTQWKSMVNDIIDRDPDILVLSEAPPLFGMYEGFKRLPGQRFSLSISNASRNDHSYHIFVTARWPVHLAERVGIVNGGSALVVIDHPSQPIRLLVVDGQSKISRLRTPMLHGIAAACDRLTANEKPVDFIVGDFNAVSRSIGFDEVSRAGQGYQLSGRSCLGWRGTWPSFFPVFDIDHIWVRNGWTVLGCRLFTNFGTDHRGQFVRLARSASPHDIDQEAR